MASRERQRPLRAIDLFCGGGGLTEGFRAAGYEVTYALDMDEDSIKTYRANHPKVTAECISITDRTPEEIADAAGGEVEVVVGGPSCQSFSTHGRKNGWVRKGDPRSDLWKQMLGIVEHLKPKAFLLENVPGMAYWKSGEFGAHVLDEFEKLGYSVTKEILLAADYGVPQRRRRLFLVGVPGDTTFEFPEQTHMGGWRRDHLELWERKRKEAGKLRHVRVWEAIGDLPATTVDGEVTAVPDKGRLAPFSRAMRGGKRTGVITHHAAFPMSADNLDLIRHVPQGGTWRDIPRHLLPDRYRGMRRTDSTNLFGRLDPELPAYTITTQFDNVTTGCFTHPYHDRALTLREAARIQTFPDRYQFTGDRTSICRQIGNAVPPLLAHVLASAIATAVLGKKTGTRLHPAPKPIKPAAKVPAPPATDKKTQDRMKRQAKRNTKPEVLLREALSRHGLRFRKEYAPVHGVRTKADIAFPGAKIAVFVHGCFWHGCPEHHRDTKSNTKWWADKIAVNKERDDKTRTALEAAGWTVVRVWEHETPGFAAERIAALVESAREIAAA